MCKQVNVPAPGFSPYVVYSHGGYAYYTHSPVALPLSVLLEDCLCSHICAKMASVLLLASLPLNAVSNPCRTRSSSTVPPQTDYLCVPATSYRNSFPPKQGLVMESFVDGRPLRLCAAELQRSRGKKRAFCRLEYRTSTVFRDFMISIAVTVGVPAIRFTAPPP